MSELLTFGELGFRHITDPSALDHVLFLLALAAIYRPSDWRSELWVISAFTAGHSMTLALAVTGLVRLPTQLIEFLIPVTIIATCAENILAKQRSACTGVGHRPILAGFFGLIHGAGFANYLKDVFSDSIGVPLLGFNLGIEAGQVVVLAIAAVFFSGADLAIARSRALTSSAPAMRMRVISVSAAVMIVATQWAVERAPW